MTIFLGGLGDVGGGAGGAASFAGAGKKCAIIGSSYTQHCHTYSSPRLSSSQRSWMDWWNTFTGNSIFFQAWKDTGDARNFSGANFGISGESSTTILARFATILASEPDFIVLQSGSNNVGSVSQVIADNTAMFQQANAAGIPVIYLSITARGAGSWSAANMQNSYYVNRAMKAYADQNAGVMFVDVNKYLNDNNTAGGRPYSYAINGDEIHYNAFSAFYIGMALHESCSSALGLFPASPGFLPLAVTTNADIYNATDNPYGNLWVNPFASVNAAVGSNAGTISGAGITAGTGSAATSVGRDLTVQVTGTSTAVATVESAGSGQGNLQVLTCTPVGASDTTFLVRPGAYTTSGNIPHGLAVGDWVQFSCYVEVSTFGAGEESGFRSIQLQMDDTNSSRSSIGGTYALLQDGTTFHIPNVAFKGVLCTPPLKLITATVHVKPQLQVIVDDTATGTGVVKSSRFLCNKIDSPLAAWNF